MTKDFARRAAGEIMECLGWRTHDRNVYKSLVTGIIQHLAVEPAVASQREYVRAFMEETDKIMKEVRVTAYRAGAEAMRELWAQNVPYPAQPYIRALPIPEPEEEKPGE